MSQKISELKAKYRKNFRNELIAGLVIIVGFGYQIDFKTFHLDTIGSILLVLSAAVIIIRLGLNYKNRDKILDSEDGLRKAMEEEAKNERTFVYWYVVPLALSFSLKLIHDLYEARNSDEFLLYLSLTMVFWNMLLITVTIKRNYSESKNRASLE